MNKVFSKALSSRFLRSAGTISGGAAAAQLIAFASAPALTRLYSPEAYGLLALMLSVVTIGITMASFHFELAIALPSREEEAADLLTLALCLGGVFSILTIPIFAPGMFNILGRTGFSQFEKLWWLIPIVIFASAAHQALTFWHLRRQRFKQVAVNGVIQSLVQNVSPMGFAAMGMSSIGLVVGLAISRVVGAAGFVLRLLRNDRGLIRFSLSGFLGLALNFKSFPTIGLLGAVLHVACFQLPAFVLTDLYGTATAGFFMLQERVLGVPVAVLGQGMASVFYVSAAKLAQENRGELRRLYFKLLRNLSLAGAVPTIGIVLVGPWLFSTVFGAEWRVAGEFAQIMAIPMFLRFVAGPLYRCLTILRGQVWILICDGIGCFVMLTLPSSVDVSDTSGISGVKVVALAISLAYAGLLGAATFVVCRNSTKNVPEILPETEELPTSKAS